MLDNQFATTSALGNFATLPRTPLVTGVTPIEAMPNLTKTIGKGQLFVKRDDAMGFAFGGNKVRQLEFYLGEALAQGADTLLITGAVQSNFVRLAAASANKLGLECHIQLEERVAKNDSDYRQSGNVFLDQLLGATIHTYPEGEDESGADAELEAIAERLKTKGRKPYVIHLAPGHPALGALGYVIAAQEIVNQMTQYDLRFDKIVIASGSGHTHGGLVYGLRALGCDIPVHGICVRRSAEQQRPRIRNRFNEISDLLGEKTHLATDQDILVEDEFLTPGYGQFNQTTTDAILLGARKESLMLDPTYSGKSMAGFLHHARQSHPKQSLLFWHTGGTPGLFAYRGALVQSLI